MASILGNDLILVEHKDLLTDGLLGGVIDERLEITVDQRAESTECDQHGPASKLMLIRESFARELYVQQNAEKRI